MKNNFCFMAFAAGQASTEGAKIKRYTGVAPVQVLAVNPNKKELESIYSNAVENEPEYVGTATVNDKEVPQIRLDFIVRTATGDNDVDFITKVVFFIRKAYRFNRDQTKVQVIDRYGRSAWVSKEQAQNHEIPMYKNGPANLDKDYRPCYVGEEELTNFLIAYLNIPSVMKYVKEKWIMVDNPENSEARLENIENYFKGDVSELRQAIALQPTNKVKVLFGVRTTDDGKQYQSVYTQMFLRNNVTDYSKLDKDLQERKANGAYSTTDFTVGNLKEYVVEATNFNNNDSDPLGAAPASSPWDFGN